MRVAIVSPYSWTVPSGVNTHVISLVGQLEARGHEVWVIAPAGGLRKSKAKLPAHFIRAGRTLPFPSNGSVAHANAWPFMIQKMDRLLARHDFDLVHVHEPTIPSVGCSATLAARVPVVATFHAAGYASAYYERWRPLAERILACVTVRIAVSEAARDCVSQHFPDDYRVIPNGTDIGLYAAARDGKKVRGRILFVGRPEPRKGLHILVEAFRGLRERVPGASLSVVGATHDQLHALMNHSHHSSPEDFRGITALGRLPLQAKLEQMRQAEIMCAPSLGGESFGLVLTEAMAAGLPLVASDIPGYRAVLDDGAAGVLVPPGDPQALEEALFSTLRSSELLSGLSEGGIVLAERYSWPRVADRIVEAYEDAIRLGPMPVSGPKVPVFGQARHFVQLLGLNGRRPRAAGSHAG